MKNKGVCKVPDLVFLGIDLITLGNVFENFLKVGKKINELFNVLKNETFKKDIGN